MASREHYQRNREAIIAKVKARYEAKKEEIRAYKKEWRKRNAEEIAAKKKAHYEAHKAEISAWHKANYEKNRDHIKARVSAYRKAQPEKTKAAVQEWCAANPERLRKIKRAYAKKRPELGRRSRANRRAREVNAFVESVDYRSVLADSGGLCGICKKPLGDAVHFDHVIPLAKGGRHERSNIQAAHPLCNTRKGAKLPEEIAQWQ